MIINQAFLRSQTTSDFVQIDADSETITVDYTDFQKTFRQDNRGSDGSLCDTLILCLLDDEAWLFEAHWCKYRDHPSWSTEHMTRRILRQERECVDAFRRRAIAEYLAFTAIDWDVEVTKG